MNAKLDMFFSNFQLQNICLWNWNMWTIHSWVHMHSLQWTFTAGGGSIWQLCDCVLWSAAYVPGNFSHTVKIKKYVWFLGLMNCTLSVSFKTMVASAYLDSDALRDFKVLLHALIFDCPRNFPSTDKPWCLLEIITAFKAGRNSKNANWCWLWSSSSNIKSSQVCWTNDTTQFSCQCGATGNCKISGSSYQPQLWSRKKKMRHHFTIVLRVWYKNVSFQSKQ